MKTLTIRRSTMLRTAKYFYPICPWMWAPHPVQLNHERLWPALRMAFAAAATQGTK